MGRNRKEFKKKDIHISLDYELYVKLQNYLTLNKSIKKSELFTRLLEEFFNMHDL